MAELSEAVCMLAVELSLSRDSGVAVLMLFSWQSGKVIWLINVGLKGVSIHLFCFFSDCAVFVVYCCINQF